MEPLLQLKMLALANRERRFRLWLTAGTWMASVAFTGFVLFLLSRKLGLDNGWLAGAVAGVAVVGWLIQRSRSATPVDWHALALRIERAHPELDGRLLTLVRKPPGSASPNSYFDQTLLKEVLAHAETRDWRKILPSRRFWMARAAHGLALLLVGVVCVGLWPQQRRVTHYASQYPLWGLNVSPGDTAVEKGAPLIVIARFSGTQPSKVELVVVRTNQELQRIPLVKSLADAMYGGSISEVLSNLTYRIEYSGNASKTYAVRVFEYPKLQKADADLAFPEYTRLQAKHVPDARRISAVQGSRLDYRFQFNKDVATATLALKQHTLQKIKLAPEPGASASLTNFLLVESGTYDLILSDDEGRTNKVQAQFVFQVLTNKTPELRIAAPKGDLRPTALQEIPFEGTVWDDFGVLAYGLGYQVVGQPIIHLELGANVPGGERRTLAHLLKLEELSAQPDQVIAWFLWADDIGPDAQSRRTTTDLYFGEVRPFEEVFREAQGGMAGQQSAAGEQGEQQGNPASKLAELQKQILNATWKLQRAGSQPKEVKSVPGGSSRAGSGARENNSEFWRDPAPVVFGAAGETPRRNRAGNNAQRPQISVPVGSDREVLIQSQEEALNQAKSSLQNQEDPRAAALWRAAIKEMETSLAKLKETQKSDRAWGEAVAAEQAAYQALLKLQEHEHQVAKSRQSRGQGSGQQAQMQQQLEQMELTQSEDRYETQSQAQRAPTAERTEQLQVLSRLQELARRQQDVNEKLKDLQSALQEAKTEKEKEELRRQLKRLQEEQQEMLQDVDELKQKMDSPQNQSRMTEQRKELDQAREDIQKAAQAAAQGSASQAAAAGARAQSRLEEMRDDLRKQSSGQFGEELREMRNEARDLAREQERIQNQLQSPGAGEPKNLGDNARKDELMKALDAQRQRVTNIVSKATAISQDAEEAQPLLSRQLQDTLRKFSQDTAKDARDLQEQLLLRGMMTRSLMEKLREEGKSDAAKLLDTSAEMAKMDLLPQARDAGSRAQSAFNELRSGVEKAADNVLGDDTEALRMAEAAVDSLAKQLESEIMREGGGTNASLGASSGREGTTSVAGDGSGRADTNRLAAAGSGRGQQSGTDPRDSKTSQNQSQRDAAQSLASNDQQGRQGRGRTPQRGQRQQGVSPDGGGVEGGGVGSGWQRAMDELLEQRRPDPLGGPIVGEGYVPWANQLRDVEQMVEDPALRNEISRVRDRAREMRQDYKRDRKKPDWAVVRMQLADPLVQVRNQIADELARRNSREALVPVDRDPVPGKYSELVRKYYEQLGK